MILLLWLATGTWCATEAQEAANARVQEKIVKYYNSRNYKQLYRLFSGEFKRSMDEDGLEYFMDYVLHDHHKQIKSARYDRNEQGAHVYLLTFEKGTFELHLSVDSDGLIESMVFLPYSKPKSEWTAKNELPGNNPLQNNTDSMCNRVVQQFGSENNLVGLSIGIIRNGQRSVYGYGQTRKGNKTVPQANTLYDLASVSKTFTGLLLAIAIEHKLVKPDDDIRQYLEGDFSNLSFNNTPITLAHLISHTSGLPRLPANLEEQPDYKEQDPYRNYTKELLLTDLKKVKLAHKPGTHGEYSNYGTALCGIILEQVFHKPYAQLVAEYITQPFGMNNTFVTIPDSLQAHMVGCYNEAGDSIADWHMNDFAAAGGISSTISDLLSYLTINVEEKTPAVKRSHTQLFKEPNGQITGYGWITTPLNNGHHLVWHNGATSGSASFCGYIKETGTAVVILNNSGTLVDDLAITLFKELR